MKKITLINLLALAAFIGCSNKIQRASESADHDWRWDVKTLNDSIYEDESTNYNKDFPEWQTAYGMPYQRTRTIRELTNWERPTQVKHASSERYWPRGNSAVNEFDIVNVKATITGYMYEDDGDIHLVLTDGDSTLIAEVPDPQEVVSWAAPECAAVRNWLQKSFGEPARWQDGHWNKNPEPHWLNGFKPTYGGKVFVVGYPFFDKPNHGDGAAANGIEIHPVVGISLVEDN